MQHSSSTGAPTSTCCPIPGSRDKGRLLPAPCHCWDVPGQIPLASMQPPKTRSAGVQRCRDVLGHTHRGLCPHVGPRASLGSSTNPLELGRKDPSWDNPTLTRPGLPMVPNPPEVPVEVGRGCRVSSQPSPAGFMEQAGLQLGPSQNQPIRSSPDLRLGFTAPAAWRGDAQTHGSCPPQPVSLQSQLRSGGVTALVAEQRVGLRWFSHGRRFPAPQGQAAPRTAL